MKKLNLRSLLVLSILTLLALPGISQKDTLHVYYKGFETKLPDSSDAKVGAWAKKLKGQKVDIQVICYYDKGDYKKYAQERTEDMFLIVNRKARDYVTITSNITKKGERSQRSLVDIVYNSTGSSTTPAAVTTNKNTATTTNNSTTTNKSTTSSSSTNSNNNSDVDSTYVNGVLKVTKKKGSKKTESPKTLEVKEGYTIDTTYVNGKMKLTKRKIK
ncbi:MAG: hypothetical protein JNJ41_18480 [Bacteroidia bacterium]|nr:hypothetical protein [Bacteroidia bacterium]